MVSIVVMIGGLVVLAASVWAWRSNRHIEESQVPSRLRPIWRWRWAIGVALGAASLFMRYPLDGERGDRYTVHGVPFVAYAFDARGRDYVGPLTMPAMAFNFATWGLLPQLALWLIVRRRRRSEHDA
jgi:hypothetical protein